jgi:hypothetical protein
MKACCKKTYRLALESVLDATMKNEPSSTQDIIAAL